MEFSYNGRVWDTEKEYYVAYYRVGHMEVNEGFDFPPLCEKFYNYPVGDSELGAWNHDIKEFRCCQTEIEEVLFRRDAYGKTECIYATFHGMFESEIVSSFAIVAESEDEVKERFMALMKKHKRVCRICEHQIENKKDMFCSHCGVRLN